MEPMKDIRNVSYGVRFASQTLLWCGGRVCRGMMQMIMSNDKDLNLDNSPN